MPFTDVCQVYLPRKNDKNGQLLLDLAQQCHVVILHTKFQKKTGQFRPTLLKRQGRRPKLTAFWLTKNGETKRRTSKRTIRSPALDLITDHWGIKLKLAYVLAKPLNRTHSKTVYDWSVLRSDENLQLIYSVTVK